MQYFHRPLTRLGLIAALIAGAADQAAKLWLLFWFDLANRGIVHLTPFLDLVLTWNTGISYGLFPQDSDFGRYGLLALKLGAVAQPLRVALTGRTTSPGIFDVLAVLGREECLARLVDQAAE